MTERLPADYAPRVVWGDLDLTAPPFAFVFGSDFGSPDTPTEGLELLLQDGEIEVSTRAGNRTMAFKVLVEDVDLGSLADAERLLAIQADSLRSTLTVNPGDGWGASAVFTTFRAQMVLERDENFEMQNVRIYSVTLRALPYAESAVETIAAALPVVPTSPVTNTISAADALTGWTVPSGTLTDDGDHLQLVSANPAMPKWTGTYDATSTPYISLNLWAVKGAELKPFTSTPLLFVNGTAATLVAVTGSGTSQVFVWQTAITSVTSVQVSVPIDNNQALRFRTLKASNQPPISGTTRQSSRVVPVKGSARTEGSFSISHATLALGDVLLYTSPLTSYSPALRQYRSGGGTVTTDTTLVSGGRESLDTAATFDIPVSQLLTGKHQIIARMRNDAAGAQLVTWTAQVRIGGVDIGAPWIGAQAHTFLASSAWSVFVVAPSVPLPAVDLPDNSSAIVRITLAATVPASSNIALDEAWVFNMDAGALTWVSAGAKTRVWIDTPTAERPRPAIFVGDSGDRSDAYNAAGLVQAWGRHEFRPPATSAFVVTTTATSASCELRHFAAWHTMPAA